MSETKRKIFVIVPPSSGHLNPVTGLVYELCKLPDLEVIFYCNEPFRELVEKTGAQFRPYYKFDSDAILCKPLHETTEPSVLSLSDQFMDVSYHVLPQLIKDFHSDKPDLIIYDTICLPAKYLLEYLKVNKLDRNTKSLYFIPSFAMNSAVMKDELGSLRRRLWIYLRGVYLCFRQIVFSWRFGLRVVNPLGLMFGYRDDLKICSVFPELQPNVETFDNSFHFVGPCIIENVRKFSQLDPRLKSILDDVDSGQGYQLIYVSMGTVFNNNVFVYDIILSAFEKLAREEESLSQHLKVVVSVGEKNLKNYEKRITSEAYKLPRNVHLFPRVPQIELLNRATLFVTHAGMNSTSEAIDLAVPLVCIPLQADQPIVAKRVCSELRLGVKLDPLKLTPDAVMKAVLEVMSNQEYKQNILELSKLSKKYNGSATAAKLAIEYMENKKHK